MPLVQILVSRMVELLSHGPRWSMHGFVMLTKYLRFSTFWLGTNHLHVYTYLVVVKCITYLDT
jgi:hypothetical protein